MPQPKKLPYVHLSIGPADDLSESSKEKVRHTEAKKSASKKRRRTTADSSSSLKSGNSTASISLDDPKDGDDQDLKIAPGDPSSFAQTFPYGPAQVSIPGMWPLYGAPVVFPTMPGAYQAPVYYPGGLPAQFANVIAQYPELFQGMMPQSEEEGGSGELKDLGSKSAEEPDAASKGGEGPSSDESVDDDKPKSASNAIDPVQIRKLQAQAYQAGRAQALQQAQKERQSKADSQKSEPTLASSDEVCSQNPPTARQAIEPTPQPFNTLQQAAQAGAIVQPQRPAGVQPVQPLPNVQPTQPGMQATPIRQAATHPQAHATPQFPVQASMAQPLQSQAPANIQPQGPAQAQGPSLGSFRNMQEGNAAAQLPNVMDANGVSSLAGQPSSNPYSVANASKPDMAPMPHPMQMPYGSPKDVLVGVPPDKKQPKQASDQQGKRQRKAPWRKHPEREDAKLASADAPNRNASGSNMRAMEEDLRRSAEASRMRDMEAQRRRSGEESRRHAESEAARRPAKANRRGTKSAAEPKQPATRPDSRNKPGRPPTGARSNRDIEAKNRRAAAARGNATGVMRNSARRKRTAVIICALAGIVALALIFVGVIPAITESSGAGTPNTNSSGTSQSTSIGSSYSGGTDASDKNEVVYEYTSKTKAGIPYKVVETVTFGEDGKCISSTLDMVFPDAESAKAFTDSLARGQGNKFTLDELDDTHAVVTIDNRALQLDSGQYENALRYSVTDLVVK